MLFLLTSNLLLWWVCSFLAYEPLQLPLFNKNFYLLLQVIVVRCVMVVITVKVVVLVSSPLIGVSLQLAGKCQGSFILDLHQDLVDWGIQWSEACEPPSGGFGAPILPSVSSPCCLSSPILLCLLLSFPLFGLLFSSQQRVFHVHVLGFPVEYIQHSLWVIFV